MNISMISNPTINQPQFGNVSKDRKEAVRDSLWTFVEGQLPQAEETVNKYNDRRYYQGETAKNLEAAKVVLDIASRLVAADYELNVLG